MAKKTGKKRGRDNDNFKDQIQNNMPTSNGNPKLLPVIVARNIGQKLALREIHTNKITFLFGVPGTGKTMVSVGYGVQELMRGKFEKLILTRPVVEAGEHLGFLPGDYGAKLAPYLMPMYDALLEFLSYDQIKELEEQHKIITLPFAFQRGLAQPLDAIVMTSSGPCAMGDIKIGDFVIGVDGEATEVDGVFPQGEKDVFRIMFSDGSSTECCNEHLWLTRTLIEYRHNKPFSIKNTKQISMSLRNATGKQKNHRIPMCKPVHFDYQDIDIDPYMLGVFLGDGSIHEKASLCVTSADQEIITTLSERLPSSMKIQKCKGSNYDYRVCSKRLGSWTNPIKHAFRSLGLSGKQSHDKFIPNCYKYNSIEVRTRVLQGLLDTDGWITTNHKGIGRIGYSSVSEQLANDVIFLVQSLGGIAYKRIRKANHRIYRIGEYCFSSKQDSYCLDIVLDGINPFMLKRKSKKYNSAPVNRFIDSIVPIGTKICQCISVQSNDQLYLTDNFIVTHNTFRDSFVVADEAQNASVKQMHMLLTRLGAGSKIVITGDVHQSDLRNDCNNGLIDAIKRLQNLKEISFVEFDYTSNCRDGIVSFIDAKYRKDYSDSGHILPQIMREIDPNWKDTRLNGDSSLVEFDEFRDTR